MRKKRRKRRRNKERKKRKRKKEKTKSAVTIWISRISSAVNRISASTPDKLPLTPPSSYRHGYYGEDLSTSCAAEKHQVSLWRHGVLRTNIIATELSQTNTLIRVHSGRQDERILWAEDQLINKYIFCVV